MTVTRELLLQRHNYYRWLLVVEVLALIGLRPLQQAPQLVCLVYLTIAGVGVLMDSPLLPQNRLTKHLNRSVLPPRDHHHLQRVIKRRRLLVNGWLIAAAMELLWQASLLVAPMLAHLWSKRAVDRHRPLLVCLLPTPPPPPSQSCPNCVPTTTPAAAAAAAAADGARTR